MADGKWISDVTAATPLEDAARRVLKVRLEVVRDGLPLAIHESAQDVEHVHQLRVATRRARAALDIFEACLPGKIAKSARKQLRKIRRTAGEARDWDVFLINLRGDMPKPSPRHRAGIDLLVGYALAQRAVAQQHLDALGEDDYPSTFDGVATETVAAVEPAGAGDPRTLIDLAQPLLLGQVCELVQAASENLDDYGHLHQVRILGKRLRYAMEVFADCFEPAFRDEFYPAIEEMQEILGLANDSHVANERLEAILHQVAAMTPAESKRVKPGIAALQRLHQERLPKQVELFKEWWTRWHDAGGEERFAKLLEVRG